LPAAATKEINTRSSSSTADSKTAVTSPKTWKLNAIAAHHTAMYITTEYTAEPVLPQQTAHLLARCVQLLPEVSREVTQQLHCIDCNDFAERDLCGSY
jgi:hypothetical protein